MAPNVGGREGDPQGGVPLPVALALLAAAAAVAIAANAQSIAHGVAKFVSDAAKSVSDAVSSVWHAIFGGGGGSPPAPLNGTNLQRTTPFPQKNGWIVEEGSFNHGSFVQGKRTSPWSGNPPNSWLVEEGTFNNGTFVQGRRTTPISGDPPNAWMVEEGTFNGAGLNGSGCKRVIPYAYADATRNTNGSLVEEGTFSNGSLQNGQRTIPLTGNPPNSWMVEKGNFVDHNLNGADGSRVVPSHGGWAVDEGTFARGALIQGKRTVTFDNMGGVVVEEGTFVPGQDGTPLLSQGKRTTPFNGNWIVEEGTFSNNNFVEGWRTTPVPTGNGGFNFQRQYVGFDLAFARATTLAGVPVSWATDPSLLALVQHESSWNPEAQNPSSTAYGLFQFLDSTWSSPGIGVAKTSDPYLQAVAGFRYIHLTYGTPARAWAFWQATNQKNATLAPPDLQGKANTWISNGWAGH